LIVGRDGSLIVRAPFQATDEQIQAVVEKKSGWIRSKLEMANTTYPKAAPKEYVNGEGFWYLGKTYRLEIVDVQETPLVLGDRFYLAHSVLDDAEKVFKTWYQNAALQVFPERVDWYASKNGYYYDQVKITDAQKRWGSCGPKRTLNFSWRLIMAPMQVIDSVVIHELVHLQEKNHSKHFWVKIKTLMPDYQQQIEWLDKNGHLLNI
jgi:predicted metal-dependent hydrolase